MLKSIEAVVGARNWSDRQWAATAGVRPETLSRLRSRGDCVFSTLEALAYAVGMRLNVDARTSVHMSATEADTLHMPAHFGREEEEKLLRLCGQRRPEIAKWRESGPAFFMAGLAVMLASV